MAAINAANTLLTQFKKQVEAGDTAGAKATSTKLKIKMTEFTGEAAVKEMALARDFLEHSLFFAISLKDNTLFDRTYTQLKPYYHELRPQLPPSQQEHPITGLNLLRLLTQNRIAEFHVELELLTPEAKASSHVAHAVQIEQRSMEGSYAKLLASIGESPSPHSQWFMQQLSHTIRDEIASCCAASYKQLLLKDAAQLLNFKEQHELLQYADAAGWQVDSQYVIFGPTEKAASEKPNLDAFHNTLTYARELERII